MDHWCAMKILLSKKILKLLLNRNLCLLSNKSFAKPTECFISSSSNRQKSTVCFKHLQNTLLEHEALSRHLAVKKFSSTRTIYSIRGTNRDTEKRQVKALYISLGLAILLCVYAMCIMEHHQDYVIIEPKDKK